jgi:hypothetical protein
MRELAAQQQADRRQRPRNQPHDLRTQDQSPTEVICARRVRLLPAWRRQKLAPVTTDYLPEIV